MTRLRWMLLVIVVMDLMAAAALWDSDALGDVNLYERWFDRAWTSGIWPGITRPWVYPAPAWLPLGVPGLITFTGLPYGLAWWACSLTVVAVTVEVLRSAGRRYRGAALAPAAWLAGLALLGPVAVFRLDLFSAAVTVAGLCLLGQYPRTAAALAAAATWVKVWPVAVLAATVVHHRDRGGAIAAALGVTSVVAACVVAAGGDLLSLLGFLTAQQTRSLQIESVAATPLLWARATPGPGLDGTTYNHDLYTWEVAGGSADAVAAASGLAMPLLFLGIMILAIWASRSAQASQGAVPRHLMWTALALTLALIVANPVGSPQYLMWPFTVVVAGLTGMAGPRLWPRWLLGSLATAMGLTHLLVPWLYDALLAGHPLAMTALTVRNLLLLGALVGALAHLAGRIESSANSYPKDGVGIREAGRHIRGGNPGHLRPEVADEEKELPGHDPGVPIQEN